VANRARYRGRPVRVHTGALHARPVAITAGEDFSLAVEDGSGHIWAWGHDYDGQLGDGDSHLYIGQPTEIQGFGGAVRGAAGRAHSLALRNDGTVWPRATTNSDSSAAAAPPRPPGPSKSQALGRRKSTPPAAMAIVRTGARGVRGISGRSSCHIGPGRIV
jgi:alpha-tubulin suppressor-like RCC1 family protein